MPDSVSFSKDFPLDAGIFTSAKLTLSAETDANAVQAILTNDQFPAGDIALGHISFAADTGTVSLKQAAVGGATVTFHIAASAHSGMGVYGNAADAIKALALTNPPTLKLPQVSGQRYLIMNWGYSAALSGSASHPIGLLGTLSFGLDANTTSAFTVLHEFDAKQGAHEVIEDTLKSWRLPRNVAFDGKSLNLSPRTWLLVEADGSLALKLAASMGWNVSFARDAKLLGITHDLSAKIDASLTASFGFNVSGKFLVVVGRESADNSVRLQLLKQTTKGVDFGLNLTVGLKGADPQLPSDFDDFIKCVFGVHGLQVLNDVQVWTDPTADLGQKLAGLADKTIFDLLKNTTGIDPGTDLGKARQILADALNIWSTLPAKVASMLWIFLNRETGQTAAFTDFTAFLNALASTNTSEDALAKALQKATFGDTPQGQFLEAVADNGLLALTNDPGMVSAVASKVLDILTHGTIAKLQAFINTKLDLAQIRNAVTDADFNHVEQWLQIRLGNFLDKTLELDDLKDIQKAIKTLDGKVADYYKTGVKALTKRYCVDFAATYQETITGTALLDVKFDLSQPDAAGMFSKVVAQSNLDDLLTHETRGVTLNLAKLTHEINRRGTVDLNMPLFDFSTTHVNDAMVSVAAEEQGGQLLLYQINAKDTVKIANRAASQLAVLASLKVVAGEPQLDPTGSIAYELRQVKAGMRPSDLEARTTAFIHQYLGGVFNGGDASIRTFYSDLEAALAGACNSQNSHLGDIALSMQLSLSASVLAGWFQPRSKSQLQADRMRLSCDLQRLWKATLPVFYFQDSSQYQFNESIAALLVWSSMPASTSIDFDDSGIKRFDSNTDVFWDWSVIDLRRAVAKDPRTTTTLVGRLSEIQAQLAQAGSKNASFFTPAMAGRFVELALNATGDAFLYSLLHTESQLARGATDALKEVSTAIATLASAPTLAIAALARFTADVTDAFNERVLSIYSGMPDRVVGPMLLVEASKALGSPGIAPAAMISLCALKPGHTFNLAAFIDGTEPSQTDIAFSQILVNRK